MAQTASSSSDNNQSKNVAKLCNSKEYDFAHSFRPVYYFSRVFGYMPYSVIFDSKVGIHRPSVRYFDILWFIIAILLYFSTGIGSFALNISHSTLTVLSVGDQSEIAHIFLGVLLIVMDMCNRFKFVEIWNKFNKIDDMVCVYSNELTELSKSFR